jgi:GDPmannose 4,6-dehydratase
MTAIIFGINGQDGYYLQQLLQKENCNIIGVSRNEGIDISSFNDVSKLIEQTKPDYIFHLAADSSTKHELLWTNYATIVTGTVNILEAVRNASPDTKVFIAGSGLQFKNEGVPINEANAFEARDAYSMCRIQSVYAARYYRTLGLKAYVGYLFNHDSPLRTGRHMSKKIAKAAKRTAAGSNEQIEIGDIDAIKEYSFAGDIVKAIWTLINQDRIFEVVIGSGEGHSIEEWLNECFSIAGVSWKDHVVPNKDFVSDYSKLVSDPSLLFSLGWKPETSFKELALMMMQPDTK